jgi:hypothetical protein
MSDTVTLYLDASDIPGIDTAESIRDLHTKTTLIYGTPNIPYSFVRIDPERREAEIVVLKTSTYNSWTSKTEDKGLSMRIDRDISQENWDLIAAIPPEPEDQPYIAFRYEYDERNIYFEEASLDLYGVHIPLSHIQPLVDFFRRKLEDRASDQISKDTLAGRY